MAPGWFGRDFEENSAMADDSLQTTLNNIDVRLTRVEQILPGLATREELRAAIAPLATREEMRAAITAAITTAVAPLATREEMHAAIAAAVAPLATREELRELRVQWEQDRHHWTMMFEDLRDDNRIILEHLLALSVRVDALARR
jgi:hypothetical protein